MRKTKVSPRLGLAKNNRNGRQPCVLFFEADVVISAGERFSLGPVHHNYRNSGESLLEPDENLAASVLRRGVADDKGVTSLICGAQNNLGCLVAENRNHFISVQPQQALALAAELRVIANLTNYPLPAEVGCADVDTSHDFFGRQTNEEALITRPRCDLK